MKMQIKFMDIEVNVHNKRERSFVNIVNAQIDRILKYWDDKKWRDNFVREGGEHWLIKEVDAMLTSMFYMKMIKEPTVSSYVFNAIRIAWLDGAAA